MSGKSDKTWVIYTDGIFDLFHVGHMNVLKQAKFALGDEGKSVFLIAGVCSDADTLKYKGLTVMDGKTRAESVEHCRWVDQVIPDAPWQLTPEFLEKHKIDFVAHDALPYVSANSEDVYAPIKRAGKFLATERTEGISTSDLIVQIVKDYDAYVERNLSRGFNKKQLNVGSTWEIRAVAHEKGKKLDASLDKMRAERKVVAEKISRLLRGLREKRPIPDSFSAPFAECVRSRKPEDTSSASPSVSEDEDELNSSATLSEGDILTAPLPIAQVNIPSPRALVDASGDAAGRRLLTEFWQVLTHFFLLLVAFYEIGVAALSYFNILHYVDKCKKTRQYNKND